MAYDVTWKIHRKRQVRRLDTVNESSPFFPMHLLCYRYSSRGINKGGRRSTMMMHRNDEMKDSIIFFMSSVAMHNGNF